MISLFMYSYHSRHRLVRRSKGCVRRRDEVVVRVQETVVPGNWPHRGRSWETILIADAASIM